MKIIKESEFHNSGKGCATAWSTNDESYSKQKTCCLPSTENDSKLSTIDNLESFL